MGCRSRGLAEDVDDLRAAVSVRPLQHPHQFAQDDRRHDDRIRPFNRGGSFDGLRLIVPGQIGRGRSYRQRASPAVGRLDRLLHSFERDRPLTRSSERAAQALVF